MKKEPNPEIIKILKLLNDIRDAHTKSNDYGDRLLMFIQDVWETLLGLPRDDIKQCWVIELGKFKLVIGSSQFRLSLFKRLNGLKNDYEEIGSALLPDSTPSATQYAAMIEMVRQGLFTKIAELLERESGALLFNLKTMKENEIPTSR